MGKALNRGAKEGKVLEGGSHTTVNPGCKSSKQGINPGNVSA
jgi:hypothetical protein